MCNNNYCFLARLSLNKMNTVGLVYSWSRAADQISNVSRPRYNCAVVARTPSSFVCFCCRTAGADTGGVDRVDIHPPFFSKKKFEMSLYLK